ncbi:site-2 protease family protein [Patescibacteria group bacterium]|nr:site-2 protease family protein [Patescibacteria group bacterium]
MNVSSVIFVIILIVSIILHEVAHGYVADKLGDPTARLQGRLSLNPLVHIDWLGSVILPLFLIVSGSSFIVGWAKPVPFNPYNFKNPRWGALFVALAGPVTNIVLAIVGSLALHLVHFGIGGTLVLTSLIITNIALAIFNLVPIPPLDGHHVLFALIPDTFHHIKQWLLKYSFVILIVFIVYGWRIIEPVIIGLSKLLL